MADDRVERLAWLIQGNTSGPLRTMELALKAVAVAKELGSDDDAPGWFAAYMLGVVAGQRVSGDVGRFDLQSTIAAAATVAGNQDPDAFASCGLQMVMARNWYERSGQQKDRLAVCDKTREAASFVAGGVTLRDAADIFCSGDEDGARQLNREWMNHGSYNKLKLQSIGKCPIHSQRPLFKLSSVLDFVEKIQSRSVCINCQLSRHLSGRVRLPAPEIPPPQTV